MAANIETRHIRCPNCSHNLDVGVPPDSGRTRRVVTRCANCNYDLVVSRGQKQDEPLRMGTFVEALILGREMHDLAVLPRQVLRAGDYVWVVDERMTLRNRKVRTLPTEGRHIYVSSGLQDGDLVSLTALRAGLPGMPVQINKRVSTLHRQDTLATAEVPRGPVQPPADAQRQVVGTTPSS